MPFDQTSSTTDVIQGIDLTGKVAVVTGASAGLGVETSRCLAAAGATVVMVGRDAEKLGKARDSIVGDLPAERLDTEVMDLAELASIRQAAAAIAARYPKLHLLINNAGVMACPRAATKDGFELQFGTNHIGHFLFTCLLAPNLLAAAPARIVNLSSSGHRFGGVDFDDPNFESREYDKWLSYGQSKTANALFSVGLNNRLSERGVTANAVHPGVIVTELGRHLDESDMEAIMERVSVSQQAFKEVPQGAATSVWAATSPDLEGRGALYLEDCQIAEPATEDSAGGVHAYALDAADAERLWQLSEQLVGQAFDI